MEIILFGLIIHLVGISSDRTTRAPTQTVNTTSKNSRATIKKDQSQPSEENLIEAGSRAAITSWSVQTLPTLRLGQVNAPDDRCNKCGKMLP